MPRPLPSMIMCTLAVVADCGVRKDSQRGVVAGAVRIEDDAFIGPGSVILPGSVVTRVSIYASACYKLS